MRLSTALIIGYIVAFLPVHPHSPPNIAEHLALRDILGVERDAPPLSQLTSADSVLLRGVALPPTQSNCGIVALFHGLKGSSVDMAGPARALRQAGLGVALFDFRGHGLSAMARTTYGLEEARDLLAVLTHLRASYARVGVVGLSMGGAAALVASARHKADAYVLEAVYATFEETMKLRARAMLGALADPLADAFEKLGGFGFRSHELRPVDHAMRLNRPTLVLAGDADPWATPNQTQALADAASGGQAVWFPGVGHAALYAMDHRRWENAVVPFMKDHLCS